MDQIDEIDEDEAAEDCIDEKCCNDDQSSQFDIA